MCLAWSFMNPTHEQQVAEIVRREYPDSVLGRCPVLLSSDVAPRLDEYRRSITTILSAFLAPDTEEHVIDLGDRPAGAGMPQAAAGGPQHRRGGLAQPHHRGCTCWAADRWPAWPARATMARDYGLDRVITADMGGTSFDVGLVIDGQDRNYEFDPVIDRWRVHLPVIANYSIGAGGGSIAHLTDTGELRVGPSQRRLDARPGLLFAGGHRADRHSTPTWCWASSTPTGSWEGPCP